MFLCQIKLKENFPFRLLLKDESAFFVRLSSFVIDKEVVKGIKVRPQYVQNFPRINLFFVYRQFSTFFFIKKLFIQNFLKNFNF